MRGIPGYCLRVPLRLTAASLHCGRTLGRVIVHEAALTTLVFLDKAGESVEAYLRKKESK